MAKEKAQAGATKTKAIKVSFVAEDWILIRDAAFAKGEQMGPLVEKWIRPKLRAA